MVMRIRTTKLRVPWNIDLRATTPWLCMEGIAHLFYVLGVIMSYISKDESRCQARVNILHQQLHKNCCRLGNHHGCFLSQTSWLMGWAHRWDFIPFLPTLYCDDCIAVHQTECPHVGDNFPGPLFTLEGPDLPLFCIYDRCVDHNWRYLSTGIHNTLLLQELRYPRLPYHILLLVVRRPISIAYPTM